MNSCHAFEASKVMNFEETATVTLPQSAQITGEDKAMKAPQTPRSKSKATFLNPTPESPNTKSIAPNVGEALAENGQILNRLLTPPLPRPPVRFDLNGPPSETECLAQSF